MIETEELGLEHGASVSTLQDGSESIKEEAQRSGVEEGAEIPESQEACTHSCDVTFRPLTRTERRHLWTKHYGEQDLALHMWTRLVEQQDLEIEMLLQMHGLLVFGVMVSTQRYAEYYLDLNEELHREHEPETADALRGYYFALVPPREQPEIGQEGLPVMSHYIHMLDVTIMSAGQKTQLPCWRGKLSQVDAFVLGATVSE